MPALLIAHQRSRLPADLADKGNTLSDPSEWTVLLGAFRDEVQDAINDRQEARTCLWPLLDAIHCGDPVAEDEQDDTEILFWRPKSSNARCGTTPI